MATKTVILAAVNEDTLVDIAAEDVFANVTARDPAPTRSNVPTRAAVPSRSNVPNRPIGY
jgi:hypothetical protein